MRKAKIILALFLVFTLVIQELPGTSISWVCNVNAADYSDGGCVAWVKDRARQSGITLPPTGENEYGLCGASAYWTTLSSYPHGSEPAANSLAVWKFNNAGDTDYGHYGHVAYVESVSGDNVTVTEGGCPGSTYNGNTGVIIRTQSKSAMATLGGCSGFYGYIYLTGSPTTPSNPVTFADQNVNGTWDTNAEVYVKIMNPNRQSVARVGCYLYDEGGNLLKSYYEDCGLTTSYVNYNCNINNDMGYTLKPGTTYKYVLYAIVNGTEYKDSARTFKTTGSSDTEKPVISDVTIGTGDGYWTIKCKATDNVGVTRVQFPTWTEANGQDDIQSNWITNSNASGTKNGDYYTYTVRISDHNNEDGIYNTHIYAYDAVGNSKMLVLPQITYSSENAFTKSNMSVHPIFRHKIVIGDTEQLNCGFSATWTSSNPEIATVDSKTGLVTGVAEGETTITATANNVTWSTKIQIVPDCEIEFWDSELRFLSAEGKDARTMQIVVTAHNHSLYFSRVRVVTETLYDGKVLSKEQEFGPMIIEKGCRSSVGYVAIDRSEFENANGIYKTTCEMTDIYGNVISNTTEYSFGEYKDNIYLKMQLGEEKELTDSDIPEFNTGIIRSYGDNLETEGKVEYDGNNKITAIEAGRTYLCMCGLSFGTRTLIIVDIEDPNKPILNGIKTDKKTTTYEVGDKINIDDLVVTATYNDGSEKTITNYVTNVDELSTEKAGEQELIITYTEGEITKQTTINLTIKDKNQNCTHTTITPSFTWSEDHATCDYEIICSDCSNVVDSGTITAIKKTTVATCTSKGSVEYTASVTYDGKTYEAEPYTEELPMLDHDYVDCEAVEPTYRTEGHTTGRVCLNCNHVEDETIVIPALSFTVVFDGNGSTSGKMESQTDLKYTVGGNLPKATFEKDDYTFIGWNSKADGTGTSFVDEADICDLVELVEENDGVVTLYAQWKYGAAARSYTISFDGNGATIGFMSDMNDCEEDKYYVLPENEFTRKGYYFVGWDTEYDGTGFYYEDAEKVINIAEPGETITLYAQWEPISYNVKFNANGGTGTMSSMEDLSYGIPYYLTRNTFKRAGYTFLAWNTKRDGSGVYIKNKSAIKNLTSVDNKTVTLYAIWKKVTVGQVSTPTVSNPAVGKMFITYSTVSGAQGYLIQYSTSSTMRNSKTVVLTGNRKTISGVEKGKTYYVRVVAFKMDSTGKKIYGKFSPIQKKRIFR
ncbi:MAG: InlB B-repeat-containing protein [Lachnospiraceae bacterium]